MTNETLDNFTVAFNDLLNNKLVVNITDTYTEEVEEYDDQDYYHAEYTYGTVTVFIDNVVIWSANDLQIYDDSDLMLLTTEPVFEEFKKMVLPLIKDSKYELTQAISEEDSFIIGLYEELQARINKKISNW